MLHSRPVRAVITGGPGAGKSTLLAALAERGVAIFPEVARVILRSPGGMELRAGDPEGFAAAMLGAELEAWHAAPNGLSIYDRGFADIVGFLELEAIEIPPALERCCRELRYDGPIFHAPPWAEIYVGDCERIQDWEEALASDAAIAAAWRRYGYDLVELPLADVDERVRFVMEHLPRHLASL